MHRSLDSKMALLDAAERLFSCNGFDRSSIRQITAAAKRSAASVNYHFGSRKNLIFEVISRRLPALRDTRIYELRRTRREASLTSTIRAYVEPYLQMWDAHPDYVRVLAHAMLHHEYAKIVFAYTRDTSQRFLACCRKIVPLSQRDAFLWNWMLIDGAILMAPMTLRRDAYRIASRQSFVSANSERMISCISATLSAPAC